MSRIGENAFRDLTFILEHRLEGGYNRLEELRQTLDREEVYSLVTEELGVAISNLDKTIRQPYRVRRRLEHEGED